MLFQWLDWCLLSSLRNWVLLIYLGAQKMLEDHSCLNSHILQPSSSHLERMPCWILQSHLQRYTWPSSFASCLHCNRWRVDMQQMQVQTGCNQLISCNSYSHPPQRHWYICCKHWRVGRYPHLALWPDFSGRVTCCSFWQMCLALSLSQRWGMLSSWRVGQGCDPSRSLPLGRPSLPNHQEEI